MPSNPRAQDPLNVGELQMLAEQLKLLLTRVPFAV